MKTLYDVRVANLVMRFKFSLLLMCWFPLFAQLPKLDQALALYRGGHLSEAVASFQALRESGASITLLDFYQGVCFAKLGDLPNARKLLQTYVMVQSTDPHGWYWLGRVQLLGRQFTEARASVQRAVELDPQSAESLRTLGEIELELQNNDGAFRAWLTANKLNPADAQTTYHLGRLFFEADFFEEAAIWLRKTLELAPNHFRAMTYLGLCAEHLQDNKTATELYRRALQQSKLQQAPYSWAYFSYAKLLRQTGHESEAFSILEESEKLCPEAHGLSLLGQLLAARSEPVRAEAVLRRAILLDSQIPEVHYRLSLLLRAKGNVDEAQSEMALFEQTKKMEAVTKNKISAIRLPEPTKH